MQSLLKIFIASFVLVLLVFAILFLAALNMIPMETGAGIALGLFLVGTILIAMRFRSGLLKRDDNRAE